MHNHLVGCGYEFSSESHYEIFFLRQIGLLAFTDFVKSLNPYIAQTLIRFCEKSSVLIPSCWWGLE